MRLQVAVTDEETKCPEYKIVAVDVLKASYKINKVSLKGSLY